MAEPVLSDARRKLVDLMKRSGPSSATELAAELGLTGVAVRQHLQGLEAEDLARSRPRVADGRGRPAQAWELTERALELFPDRHGELTVGLLDAMKSAFGDEGLERIVAHRAKAQVERYRAGMPGRGSLKARVEALARQRTAEGYMAEVEVERPGSYLLVEHHCPICEAASSCLRLCSSELEVFQRALGEDVAIERTAHLLSGDSRCVYRVRKR